MKPIARAVVVTLFCCVTAVTHADQSQTRRTLGGVFGDRIAAIHASMSETIYSHSTKIDLEKGVLVCDCSGFLDFVLREEFPEHYVSLRGKEQPTRKRPLAVTFHETFVAAAQAVNSTGPWMRIDHLMDVQPGDVLAWRKDKIVKGSTTGHVCMVASSPKPVGKDRVQLRLIDSTRSPHENDTRADGTTGVGSGLRTFVMNHEGQPIAKLHGKEIRKANIAIGRMTRFSSPVANAEDLPYIGLTTEQAVARAESSNTRWQVIRKDGRPQPLKWAIDEDRLSLVVAQGRVLRVMRG